MFLLLFVFVGCSSPSNKQIHAGTNEDVLTDSANVFSLRSPPVTKLGRHVEQGPGMLSLSDDYGNYVRVEVLSIPGELFAASRSKGGDQGLLRYFFDTQYYPATYAKINAAKEESRSFFVLDETELLFVAIDLPAGSVLSANGQRLDAKRYVASFAQYPFCVYLTVEANGFSSDLSSPHLVGEAKKKLSEIKQGLTLRSIATSGDDGQ